jgi:YVTN family beta-propeller protein
MRMINQRYVLSAAAAGSPVLAAALALLLMVSAPISASDPAKEPAYLSPSALAPSPDGGTLYIAYATAGELGLFDTASRAVTKTVPLSGMPLGLALTPDGKTLYVTCAAPESTVWIIDTAKGEATGKIPTGHTAQAPVLSPDGKTLFVCLRFNNAVAVIDLETKKELRRITVPREPVGAAITPDGKFLLVANHIHAGRADVDVVTSSISIIDVESGKVAKEIFLPNGSGLLRDVRISPDGRYAVVAHIVARFHLPTTQVERGWINSNGMSVIDLAEQKLLNTVLLDNIDSGAANPWGVAWSADGKNVLVTHAGTHELSVVDFPALLSKLKAFATAAPGPVAGYTTAARRAEDIPNDLSFMVGLRQRVKLSEADRGPRSVTLIGNTAWLGNYFTDTVSAIDLAAARPRAESVPLGSPQEMTVVRQGEFFFNDATICFQGWQSCASCHSSDARVDGLNWDNLNDGIGNPKNVKSLLQAHQTPPSMWLGVRSNAHVGVRAGIRNSLFTVQPESTAVAIDEYLKSLVPLPSPFLVKGELSPAAARGEKVFMDDRTECSSCHRGPYYTDMKFHNVGTIGKFDNPTNRFDTPTLIELWRTAPYLHDGRAATLRDVFDDKDEHGMVTHLTPQEMDDLLEYLLSL